MRVLQMTRKFGVAVVVALAASGCGDVARTGRSPGYLIIDSLQGASGAEPDKLGTTVSSDVVTLVTVTIGGTEVRVPTIYGDPGRVSLRVGLKNPGTTVSPTAPSSLNAITVSRYRVVYRRADGRNTQGVDVPYAFDGAMTITVPEDGTAAGGFDLVRVVAKDEPPLRNLGFNGGAQFIATLAEVTFYGRDQAGNEVSVTGNISVSFADFGDPQ